MTDHDGKTTTDHDAIRAWVEARGGRPARVADTGDGGGDGGGGGILRIDFQEPDEGLEEIDWETFFEVFEDRKPRLPPSGGDRERRREPVQQVRLARVSRTGGLQTAPGLR
jgi:hypothetical protein